MTEHEDREAHAAKADELERQLDDMQERSERLGGEIEGAGEDWERKKSDDSVPGAGGEPGQADGPDPEAEYPGKGGEVDADELDFGRDVDPNAVVPEDGPPDDEDESGESSSSEDDEPGDGESEED